MSALDPIQVSLAGLSLIEASAGTGKTHTITTIVLRLLIEQGLDVRGILVLTYTKAATAELRERIRARISELLFALEREREPSDDALRRLWDERRAQRGEDTQRLRQALRDFDEAPIFTIHGFCQRVLGERALESRTAFDVELIENMLAMIDEIAIDLWEQATYSRAPETLRALQREGLDIDEVRKVVALAVREPSLPIVPELGDQPPEPNLWAIELARKPASELWARERGQVLALIRVETFSQTSHKLEAMHEVHAPALDTLKDGVTSSNIASVRKLTNAAVVKAIKKGGRTPSHPFFAACDALDAAYQEFEQGIEALARYELGVIARRARELIETRKRERGVQSFEDLLSGLARALEGDAGEPLAQHIAKRYPALLVDEFQDTDPTQYAIFMRLFGGGVRTMLLIGDPKQAIYGFRGADVHAYMEAASHARERTLRLGVNHRSDPALVHAVNTLFDRPDPFLIPDLGYQRVEPRPGSHERLTAQGSALEVLFVSRDGQGRKANGDEKDLTVSWADEHLPAMVASDIVRFLSSGAQLDGRPVVPQDIAVLCRTNDQGRLVQEALGARGVPVALDGDSTVFKSETAEELCRVLAAMASPSDLRAVKSALATELLGWNAEDLLTLEQDDARLSTWLEHMMRAHVRWLERGFVQSVHGFLIDARVHERLLKRRDGQRRLTDALHVIELLHADASREHLGPLALVRRLESLCADIDVPSNFAAESAQLRLESDEHAVRITTVHRSKGLQYPIVYCPFLWHTRSSTARTTVRFHDDEQNATIDVKSAEFKEHKQRAEDEERAEQLRLSYVALTRAKHRCLVVWGGFPRIATSALGQLFGVGSGNDGGLRAELGNLRARSDGAIGWRTLRASDDALYRGVEETPNAAPARRLTRLLPLSERLTSFSRIAKHASHDNAELIAEGMDRDAVPSELAVSPVRAAEMPGTPGMPGSKVTLAGFPAGPNAGTLVHSIYERIDFQELDADELARETRTALIQGQLDVDAHAETLVRGIAETLRTPILLEGDSFTLASIAPRARVNELEFMLEIERGSAFSSASIADTFATHHAPLGAPGYAAHVRALRQGAIEGFLRGFIDLVLQSGERFYVVDYKSNHLGDVAADYADAALRDAMIEHHYYLQAYLYTLALHRYLSARLRDYDYDKHIGGYAYLFLRGMAPGNPSGTGVLAERPPRALIEQLSQLLRSEGGRP